MPRRRRSSRRPRRQTRAGRRPRWGRRLLLGGLLVALLGVIALDVIVVSKFEGRKWAVPARVYASPLELFNGAPVSRARLLEELRELGYRQSAGPLRPGQYQPLATGVRLHSRGFVFADGREQSRRVAVEFAGGQVAAVAGEEQSVPLLRLEPREIGGIYPQHLEDRVLVQLDAVPAGLVAGLIAVEDRHFLDHHGISFTGIARAMLANVQAGRVVQGGSTLTQQLVKNFYLTRERSWLRKGVEAVMALLLELHYDKDTILETYLNEVYLGQSGSRGIHGIGLASRHYFRQPLHELGLHQQALLIALIKGPAYYDPWRHPQRARERRDLVLSVMAERNIISAANARAQQAKPLDVVAPGAPIVNSYPAYLDLVKRQLRRDYRAEDLQSEGLRIFTAFDPAAQAAAEQALSARLQRLERDYRLEQSSLQGAVVVARVGGEVTAVVGDRQPRYVGFNRALDADRPIGSLVKPAIYLAALRQPERYQLSTLISDAPVTVAGRDGSLWQPVNFDHRDHGNVPLYRALAESYNQATARLGMELGVAAVHDQVAQLGVAPDWPAVPATLLGSGGLTPLEVTTLYHSLANGGFYTPLRAIREVQTAGGEALNRYPYQAQQRVDPASLHLLLYALQVVVREGTGAGVYSQLPQGLALAGKTGTSDDQRDSWFAGFSGSHVAVTWVGRDDNGMTPLTGASGALPIWAQVMAALPQQDVHFVAPENVVYAWVDGNNGQRSAEYCRDARQMPFIAGTVPDERAHCIPEENPVWHWLRELLRS